MSSDSDKDNSYNSDDDQDYNPEIVLLNKKNKKCISPSDDELSSSSSSSSISEIANDTSVKTFVRTRRQRQNDLAKEQELQQLNKYGNILLQTDESNNKEQDLKIDTIFNKLNDITKKIYKRTPINSKIDILNNISATKLENILLQSQNNNLNGETQVEMITIKRIYKFAGKIVTEDLVVPKDSAMGQEYLQSLKFNDNENKNKTLIEEKKESNKKEEEEEEAAAKKDDKNSGLRRPLKRKSILNDIINGNNSKYTKISTLDKSKIDWANYVDSQRDMKETLESGWKGQKGGYLERKKFIEARDLAK
ncbi:hypothetical protein HANVADRAFT_55804 [Hanseniaspora valbyensis NRRL Y-1626]|uniref:SWR1-complex protein 5 n=1 Tax=Hanseniaspora valbyensis NRRL Y-1626 TaxID=766949 RepID=A0A1B7TF57_9ASCO|nr:hypothetical protein HANVADRAFT_55804 [Hanseniaspora valbyensis NRRL Y-1626]